MHTEDDANEWRKYPETPVVTLSSIAVKPWLIYGPVHASEQAACSLAGRMKIFKDGVRVAPVAGGYQVFTWAKYDGKVQTYGS